MYCSVKKEASEEPSVLSFHFEQHYADTEIVPRTNTSLIKHTMERSTESDRSVLAFVRGCVNVRPTQTSEIAEDCSDRQTTEMPPVGLHRRPEGTATRRCDPSIRPTRDRQDGEVRLSEPTASTLGYRRSCPSHRQSPHFPSSRSSGESTV